MCYNQPAGRSVEQPFNKENIDGTQAVFAYIDCLNKACMFLGASSFPGAL